MQEGCLYPSEEPSREPDPEIGTQPPGEGAVSQQPHGFGLLITKHTVTFSQAVNLCFYSSSSQHGEPFGNGKLGMTTLWLLGWEAQPTSSRCASESAEPVRS